MNALKIVRVIVNNLRFWKLMEFFNLELGARLLDLSRS